MKKWNKILIEIFVASILIFSLSACNQPNKVDFVKNGSPYIYPDKTYGEALSDFFASPKWISYRDEDGNDIVEFTGIFFPEEGESSDFLIQFITDEKEFTPIFMSVDSEPITNENDMVEIITTIFDS